jgi:hypothetical protein
VEAGGGEGSGLVAVHCASLCFCFCRVEAGGEEGSAGLAAVLRLVQELKEADLANYRRRITERGRGGSGDTCPTLHSEPRSAGI